MTTPIKTAEISPRLKATLLGAGLGGAVGGLGDWLTRDEDSPDSTWDGILSGAALGGYLGHRGATLGGYLGYLGPGAAESKPSSSNLPARQTTTLADHLPPGYRNEAKPLAEAYRKLRPDVEWKEQITDKAIDRKVPVDYGDMGGAAAGTIPAQALYNPNTDRIRLKDPSDTLAMTHELTHAAQTHSTIQEDAEHLARHGRPEHAKAVSRLSPKAPQHAVEESHYLTDPQEEEAYLADIKRKFYQGTGKHVRTPEEAREAIDWRMRTIRHGEELPLLDARLHQSRRNSKLQEPREEWIKALIQRMPGLVQNDGYDLSKTATFSGANAMTPTPNMGGFMGGLPAGNNFSRTFQPGMPALPAKPNPLAAASPVQSMKADTNGIQTAMAKRGSQDNSAKRTSATGESDGVGYKLDDDGHTTGGSAFGTLDKYMKKAGLNSFQARFFGRMIQAGLDESQLRQAVKQAQAQFGPEVAQELAAGLEKLAFNTALMAGAGRAVRGGINFARGLTGTKSLVDAATKLNMGAKASRQASPALAMGQKINLGAQQLLNPAMQPAKQLFKNKDVVQGLTTGAFNPYTGLMSSAAQNEDGSLNYGKVLGSTVLGGLAGKGLGKTQFADAARRIQRQSLAGSNLVSGTGLVANMAGSDVDTPRAAQLAGLGAAFLPRKLSAIPGVRNLAANAKVPAGIRGALLGHTDEALDALRPDQFIANQVRNVGNAGRKAVENYADGIPLFPGGRQAATNMAQNAANTIGDKYRAVAPNVRAQYDAVKPTLDNARNFVTNNPAKAIGAGLGGTALAAGGYGLAKLPGAVERGIENAGTKMLQSPEIQQRLQGMDDIMGRGHAMLNQGQQTLSNVNSAVSPFVGQGGQSNLLGGMLNTLGLGGEGSLGSRIGGFIQENPELAARGLLGLLGAGGGYMAGGSQGAALGGLSLPLMHYLAQQYGGSLPDYFGNNAAEEANAMNTDTAPTAQPPVAVVPQENEIRRQQQQTGA